MHISALSNSNSSCSQFSRAGFTLIELLVVTAIIALLISILLPSPKHAREQGKRAVCLSNLRSVAQGTGAYSTEDPDENAIPIQQQMVTAGNGVGFLQSYGSAVAIPFAYGGRTAQVPAPGGCNSSTSLWMIMADGPPAPSR